MPSRCADRHVENGLSWFIFGASPPNIYKENFYQGIRIEMKSDRKCCKNFKINNFHNSHSYQLPIIYIFIITINNNNIIMIMIIIIILFIIIILSFLFLPLSPSSILLISSLMNRYYYHDSHILIDMFQIYDHKHRYYQNVIFLTMVIVYCKP